MKIKKVVVGIYMHPELFPPTLNAISLFADNFESVFLIFQNVLETKWQYAMNITTCPVGKYCFIRDFEKLSPISKIFRFISFICHFWKNLKDADLVVIYDEISLLAFRIASFFRSNKKNIIWYHNHDISEISRLRKYSIGWWSVKNEKKMFKLLDIFSLPSEERKKFFPLDSFKGKFFFLPNYPSKKFYSQFESIIKSNNKINILFQGQISYGHGIEEICEILPLQIKDKNINLILKGFVKNEYKEKILEISTRKKAVNSVDFIGVTPYQDVPKLTSQCHIGIAIFKGQDIMNSTLGTASNKIYEYAACGLPIIYYNNKHFSSHLNNYPWAVKTDLSKNSILEAIEYINANFDYLSKEARNEFKTNLNFEKYFVKPLNYLKTV